MTNDEIGKERATSLDPSGFVIASSFVIRISSFLIRFPDFASVDKHAWQMRILCSSRDKFPFIFVAPAV
jgi:hypothetical protein